MLTNPTLAHVKRVLKEQGLASAISHCDYCAWDLNGFLTSELLYGERGSLWVAALGSSHEAGCQQDKNSLRQLLYIQTEVNLSEQID